MGTGGRPPAESDRGSRLQLIAIVVITVGLMVGGILVGVLGRDFPFVPDATPVPAAEQAEGSPAAPSR